MNASNKLLEASTDKTGSKIFYLADHQPVNIKEMADFIQATFQAKTIRSMPISVLKAIALGGDFFKLFGWKSPPFQ